MQAIITIDRLAVALRGIPRNWPIYVQTETGLRPVVLVSTGDGGERTAAGNTTGAIVLMTESDGAG